MSEADRTSGRRLVQQLTQAGAAAGRDFSQTAKYAAGRDQTIREIHLHVEQRGDGELPSPPAWVTDTGAQAERVFGVPLFPSDQFSGREDTFKDLTELLTPLAPPRFLVIAGTAGVGKTQLAVEYAYNHQDEYDVIWWVRADQATTLLADFTGLAAQGLVASEAGVRSDQTADQQTAAVRTWLERHDNWLLVFDNASDLADLRPLLPRSGGGRVILTSRRETAWAPIARVLSLDVLDPESASAFLRRRSGHDDLSAADELVRELGCLPLALEQAGAFISQTAGFGLRNYLDRFRAHNQDLLDRGEAYGYEGTIGTTWDLSLERLRHETPDAIELLGGLAFLDPDDIPLTLMFDAMRAVDLEGDDEVPDALEVADAVAALRAYGLIKAAGDGLFVHRLLQAVVRNSLEPDEQRTLVSAALSLIAVVLMQDEMGTAPESQRLISHALAAAAHAEQLDADPKATSFVLGSAAASAHARGQYSQAVQLYRRALAADQGNAADPRVMIEYHNAVGMALLSQGSPVDAQSEFEQAIALASQAPDAEDPSLVFLRGNLGLALRRQGLFGRASAEFDRAIEQGERVLDADDLNLVRMYNNRGLVLQAGGDWAGAQAEFERAVRLGSDALGPDNVDLMPMRSNLGVVLLALRDLERARDEFRRAIDIGEQQLGPEHPDLMLVHANLGNVLLQEGEIDAARAELEQAIGLGERVLGPDHPDLVIPHSTLGIVRYQLGDVNAARIEFERAVELGERVLGPDHPDLLVPYTNLGDVLRGQGDYDGARAALERAIELGERVLGPDHPDLRSPLSSLGVLLRNQGNYDRAQSLFERTIRVGESVLGPDHPDLMLPHIHLGSALLAQGEPDQAQIALQRAIGLGDRVHGPGERELPFAHVYLEAVLRQQGEPEAARRACEHAIELAQHCGKNHPQPVTYYTELGELMQRYGDLDGARRFFELAITDGEQLLGPDHPDLPLAHSFLGDVLQAQEDLQGARAEFERAIALGEHVPGPGQVNLALYHEQLGIAIELQGDLEGAQAEFQTARELGDRVMPDGGLRLGYIYHRLGETARQLHDLPQALAALERALNLLEDALGPEDAQLGVTLLALARAEHGSADPTSAREHLERGLRIGEVAGAKGDGALEHALLGRVLCDLNEFEPAGLQLEEAQLLITEAQSEDSAALSPVLADLGGALAQLDQPQQAKASLEWALAVGGIASTDDPRAAPILDRLQPVLESLATAGRPEQPGTGTAPIPDRIDAILPGQRDWLFDLRRRALQGHDLRPELERWLADDIAALVEAFTGAESPADWDLAGLRQAAGLRYGFPVELTDAISPYDRDSITEGLCRQASSAWDQRVAELDDGVIGPLERFLFINTVDQIWPRHRKLWTLRLAVDPRGDDAAVRLADLNVRQSRALSRELSSHFLQLLFTVEVTLQDGQDG